MLTLSLLTPAVTGYNCWPARPAGYNWTQDTRADREAGTLSNLDAVTISGTLHLGQR